jgi:hypothetical protein
VVAQIREDYPTARAFYERSLPLWHELDDKRGFSITRFYLGTTLMRQGEAAAAYARFAEILPIARERNSHICVVETLAFLGWAAGAMGRWEETAARCVESLAFCSPERAGQRIGIEWGLYGLAQVALVRGNPARAARLLGATEAVWDGPVSPPRRRELDRTAAAIRAHMEPAEYEAAWSAGHALPLDQAIALALEGATDG